MNNESGCIVLVMLLLIAVMFVGAFYNNSCHEANQTASIEQDKQGVVHVGCK